MKLAAFDQDDLIVISAHLQDAMVLVSDMTYLGSTQRFVFACDRPLSGDQYMTGVHFERVIRTRVSNLPPRDSKIALKLLGITFISTASPAGEVVLLFDGDAAIRLSVECLEVAMADFSAVTG